MNRFHITYYKIYDSRIINDYRILIISDLHYNDSTKSKKLTKILKKIKDINPNYIFIPGDLLDYQDIYYDKKVFLGIKIWLKQLSFIAPVFISLGNHEYYTLNMEYNNNFVDKYVKELNKINNVHFLNNECFVDNNMSIIGFNLSKKYYSIEEYREHKENKDVLLKELDDLNNAIKTDKNKLSFLLVHSPVYFKDKSVFAKIKNYNYVITGHMHNGCVPPLIYELWKSTRGFIAPNKKLLSKNTRNTLNKKEDKLLVNGPLIMFSKRIFLTKALNMLYPMYMSVIDFTNDKTYKNKNISYVSKYEK